MRIRAKFRFRKAGQGCFYTGWFDDLHNSGFKFTVAYDCGTLSKDKRPLLQSIHSFKFKLKLNNNNRLDLLMISHLDADHVNHLGELLKDLDRCETVIMPYLTLEERLVLYAKALHDAGGRSVLNDYRNFMLDPVSYLMRYENIGQIILLRGDEESLANNFGDGPPPDPDNRDSDQEKQTFVPDDREIKQTESTRSTTPEVLSWITNRNVHLCDDKTRFFIKDIWEFYFYCRQMKNEELVSIFHDLVHIQVPVRADLTSIDVIRSLFEQPRVLRKIYRDVFHEPNLNHTSMVVWHGATDRTKEYGFFSKKTLVWRKFRLIKDVNGNCRTGTLLTGDIPLDATIFPDYISANARRTIVLQLPHHGSSTGWDITKLYDQMIELPGCCVVNFGLGNRWGHPKISVINDLRSTLWGTYFAHELKSFKYDLLD